MALHAAISAIYIAILASNSALALSQQNILDEFSVSYRLASPITLHEPVIVHVSIVNVGDESLLFDLGFNRKKAFQFTVIDPAGHRITLGPVKEEGIDGGGLVRLEPKRTYTQRMILNEWYEFDCPGSYRVEIRLTLPVQADSRLSAVISKENVLEFEILPRDEAVLERRCRMLLNSLKGEKWLARRSAMARELSYIKDPVAIPYLQALVDEGEDYYAINGLMRIGSDRAMEAMIRAAESNDVASAQYARSLLRAMLPKIQDQRIRDKVAAVVKIP